MTKFQVLKARSKSVYNCRYPGQLHDQPAYILVDWRHQTINAEYAPELGGVPMFIWEGYGTPFYFNNDSSRGAVNRTMKEIVDYLQNKLLEDCYEEVLENGNYRGRINPEVKNHITKIVNRNLQ